MTSLLNVKSALNVAFGGPRGLAEGLASSHSVTLTEAEAKALARHPESARYGDMAATDMEWLRNDLKWNGQTDPILLCKVRGKWTVLDGWHRLCALLALGTLPHFEAREGTPKVLRTLAASLNLFRRHLTPKIKLQLAIDSGVVARVLAEAKAAQVAGKASKDGPRKKTSRKPASRQIRDEVGVTEDEAKAAIAVAKAVKSGKVEDTPKAREVALEVATANVKAKAAEAKVVRQNRASERKDAVAALAPGTGVRSASKVNASSSPLALARASVANLKAALSRAELATLAALKERDGAVAELAEVRAELEALKAALGAKAVPAKVRPAAPAGTSPVLPWKAVKGKDVDYAVHAASVLTEAGADPKAKAPKVTSLARSTCGNFTRGKVKGVEVVARTLNSRTYMLPALDPALDPDHAEGIKAAVASKRKSRATSKRDAELASLQAAN